MSIAEITKSLKGLKREVEDIHPHLKAFLPQLPGVERVEYTHGPGELGADFILTIKDIISTNYVGVVVKRGGISQKNIFEVENQIEQCLTVKRPIHGGKHESRLHKVWVIFTGLLSANVKKVIEAKSRPGVDFIDVDKLAELMYNYKYSFDSNLPSSISVCLKTQSLIAKQSQNQTIGLGIDAVDDIYINQKVVKLEYPQYRSNKQYRKIKHQSMLIERAVEDNKYLIIYGEPGSGKSKMLCKILSHYATDSVYKKTNAIPLIVSCKDMQDIYDMNIANMITDFKSEHSLPAECSYIVIIDGIDELDLSRDERLKCIEDLRKDAFKGNDVIVRRLIFASRDYFEDKSIDIPIYKISPLSTNEIIPLIKTHLDHLDSVNRIVQDIRQSDIFHSLQQNPLAVIILISLLKDEKGIHELPANLTELYSKYAECSLGRWDTGVHEGKKQRRYEASKSILSNIAKYMIDHSMAAMSQKQAEGFFDCYLRERNLGIDPNELFNDVTQRSDLLCLNDGVFRFRHRVIGEFFYACKFTEEDIDNHQESVFDIKWVTILYFYVGLQKDCAPLLEKISNIRPRHESGVVLKAMNMSNILLAGYASPYDGIQKALQNTFVETSEYVEDIINGRVDAKIASLSTMHVLIIFRIIMDYKYSRDFFKRAIEESILRMEDMKISDNVKSTSMFLINMPYKSLGGDNVFESMIQKISQNNIPMHIRLAIKHESDAMENFGHNLKKFVRHMKRSVNKLEIAPLYFKQIKNLPNKKDSEEKD